MIWIIGGTSEGDCFSKRLGDTPHIITLGTREGLNYYSGANYQFKRMDFDEMKEFIREKNIHIVIDLTHPFAVNVSHNAKKACKDEGIDYYCFERNVTEFGKNTIEFCTYEEFFAFLTEYSGTVFLTTGSNRVEDFEKVRGDNRFVYRVLPMIDSVTKLNNLGIHMKDIVAMVGPYTKELDMELYRFFGADGVVMKDSGEAGGTDKKIEACEALGIKSFVITRKKESCINFNEFINKMLKIISN